MVSATIPTTEPNTITAGATTTWRRDVADYPVGDGWTLTYAIRGASSLDITCTTDGNYFLATISATASSLLTAGRYWWQAYATKDTERYLVNNGQLTVVADLADVAAGYDGRSHAQIMLDALEALIQGKASRDQLSCTIGNTQIGRMTPEQVEHWRDVYRREVVSETRSERAKRGLPSGRFIGTRFTG